MGSLPRCRVYPGSIHDAGILRNAVLEREVLSGGKSLFVLDKGFYRQANIRHLVGMEFIIPLPVKTCVYRQPVSSAKDTIRSAAYAIRHGEPVYYGMRRGIELAGSELTAPQVYLDERRQATERERFLRALLEGEALLASQGFTDKARIEAYLAGQMPGLLPYFTIRKRGANCVPVRSPEKTDGALGNMGLFVLVANTTLTGETIREYYRERDGVENCFDSAQNNLFLKRLRVHSGHTLEGILFIAFIALILRSSITGILKQTKSLKGLWVPELISELRKLKQITFGRKKVLTEISRRQKDIFSAFGIDPGHLT
jgi:transposase